MVCILIIHSFCNQFSSLWLFFSLFFSLSPPRAVCCAGQRARGLNAYRAHRSALAHPRARAERERGASASGRPGGPGPGTTRSRRHRPARQGQEDRREGCTHRRTARHRKDSSSYGYRLHCHHKQHYYVVSSWAGAWRFI